VSVAAKERTLDGPDWRHRLLRALGWVSRQIQQRPLGALSLVVVLALLAISIAAPLIATHEPTDVNVYERWRAPSTKHLLGTDSLGRDVFSRVIWGGQISLAIGLGAAFIGTTMGALLGLASGFWLGRFDLVIQRIVDGVQSVPALISALAFVYALGPSRLTLSLAIGVPIAAITARVMRSTAVVLREETYVEAARSLGAPGLYVLARHIAPNSVAPYLVLLTAHIGWAIVVEASLGFLGLGIPPPTPTWGGMLVGAQKELLIAPWTVVVPGAVITVAALAFNLAGDAIRDSLDPRLRQ
jgi:peptide/nickel transport system permease protein